MIAVEITRNDAVATVALNRPDRLNALDRAIRWELIGALREVAADPDVRAVVLTGTGRAFCVGQDLSCAPSRRWDDRYTPEGPDRAIRRVAVEHDRLVRLRGQATPSGPAAEGQDGVRG